MEVQTNDLLRVNLSPAEEMELPLGLPKLKSKYVTEAREQGKNCVNIVTSMGASVAFIRIKPKPTTAPKRTITPARRVAAPKKAEATAETAPAPKKAETDSKAE